MLTVLMTLVVVMLTGRYLWTVGFGPATLSALDLDYLVVSLHKSAKLGVIDYPPLLGERSGTWR